ncbi:MAG: hypothetical protein J7K22_04030 [Nanoarchaeota archaeon]|nr:hypothetical protein [Nanoarchaeota archaeon]
MGTLADLEDFCNVLIKEREFPNAVFALFFKRYQQAKDSGFTLPDIFKELGCTDKNRVKGTLDLLCGTGVLEYKDNRYYPKVEQDYFKNVIEREQTGRVKHEMLLEAINGYCVGLK